MGRLKQTPSDKYSDIYNRILEITKKQGIAITVFVKKFRASASSVEAWRNGNINPALLPQIADELGVSLDYLLRGGEHALVYTVDTDKLIETANVLTDTASALQDTASNLIETVKNERKAARERNELSPDEEILIETYRRCSYSQKQKVQGYVQALSERDV